MSDVALFLISLAVTIAGLLASWAAHRRSGSATALRGVALSLLPMAAFLTGLTGWLTGLVLNPVRWAGVVLAGLAVVLYLVSGVMLGRRAARVEGSRGRAAARAAGGGRATRGAVGSHRDAAAPATDPDLSDVEEILRRRGIR